MLQELARVFIKVSFGFPWSGNVFKRRLLCFSTVLKDCKLFLASHHCLIALEASNYRILNLSWEHFTCRSTQHTTRTRWWAIFSCSTHSFPVLPSVFVCCWKTFFLFFFCPIHGADQKVEILLTENNFSKSYVNFSSDSKQQKFKFLSLRFFF